MQAAPPSAAAPHRDRLRLVLAALCAADFAVLAPALLVPDLNLDYPWMDGDSWDWIANGLFLAGHDVRYSGRAPLLPLAIAGLDRLGVLSWLPLLLLGLFLGTILAFYGLAARLYPRPAAFVASLVLLASFSLGSLALDVMADVPAACLLLLAARSFLLAGAEGEPRRYLAGGVLAGLAALTQPVGLLWAPAVAVTVAARRRRDLRSPRLWAGLLACAGLQIAWWAVRRFGLGVASDVSAQQWELLRLHGGSWFFYAFSLAGLLGLPALALAALGLALALRRTRASDPGGPLFAGVLAAMLLVFFVLLYDFNARRFLVYVVWPAALFMAEGLARIGRGKAFAAVAALLVAGAALPLPGAGHDPSWMAVWPLPPVYAHASVTAAPSGSARLAAGDVGLLTRPVASWRLLGNAARVWRARRLIPFPGERLDSAVLHGGQSALYLYRDPTDGGGRYRTMTRLGNALRKRTKFVPAWYFDPYWRWIEVGPLGAIAPDYALYRARLPGGAASWIVAAAARGPVRQRLDALAARPPLGIQGTSNPALVAARAKAAAIQQFVMGHDGIVALLTGDRRADLSQLYLPFLLASPELFVVEPGREAEVHALLAPLATLAARELGATEVRKVLYLGRRTSVIRYR